MEVWALTLTDRLAEAVEAASKGTRLPKCEHLKGKIPFRCLILQQPQLECLECHQKTLSEGTCDVCGNPADGSITYSMRFEKSSGGKDMENLFVSLLCPGCGSDLPEGTRGTFSRIFEGDNGHKTFLAYKLVVSKGKERKHEHLRRGR